MTRAERPAAAAALAATLTCRQVRLPVHRHADTAMNAGRMPMRVSYDVGFDDVGRVKALDIVVTCQVGGRLGCIK